MKLSAHGHFLCVLFFIFVINIYPSHTASSPAFANKNCPRKHHLIGSRKCKKECQLDSDCRGRKKRCVCDDVCGLSCLNPRGKCPRPELTNGKVRLDGRNQLGAVARYSCDSGYELSGIKTRLCTGDRRWSGVAPRCLPATPLVDMNNLDDPVKDSPRTVSKDLGVQCSEPPSVLFADHDGPKQTHFSPGAEVTYACRQGYMNDGITMAKCMTNGKWAGPMLTCREVACPYLGELRNGRVFGLPPYEVGSKVNYECQKDYRLVGQPGLTCKHGGLWDGSKPVCQRVSKNSCERLRKPRHGVKIGRSYTIGSVVTVVCDSGYEIVGTAKRVCQSDLTWSGQSPVCEPINCGDPGRLYNGYIVGTRFTFDSIIRYRCMDGTTFDGLSMSAKCLATKKWSFSPPRCLRSCLRPAISKARLFINSTAAQMLVDHGSSLNVICDEGLAPSDSTKPVCNNGTWSRLPTCIQDGCDHRPKEIANGIALYRGTRYGDRVRYTCNTGHKLVGDKYLICQGGKWKGNVPECKPVFCPHPGELNNGKILLVGDIGKFEYRPYVRKAGQGEKIEYYCSTAHRLEGPTAATCIDGYWSPDRRPKCIDNQHPILPDSQELFTT